MVPTIALLLFWVLSLTQTCQGQTSTPPQPQNRIIRIAADPNNLPFTNDKLEGFENRIAELLGRELNAQIEYVWRGQRRGSSGETSKEDRADLVLGIPAGCAGALATKPYYHSSYVFVYPKDKISSLKSLDDPQLRTLRVGVTMIGDDGMNSPPARALANRGVVTNVVGFTLYGDSREATSPARIIEAVASGEVDVAIVWGPLAGYFAPRQKTPLAISPVEEGSRPRDPPFSFGICVGTPKRDQELRDALDRVLDQNRAQIEQILDAYGVPRISDVHAVKEKSRIVVSANPRTN